MGEGEVGETVVVHPPVVFIFIVMKKKGVYYLYFLGYGGIHRIQFVSYSLFMSMRYTHRPFYSVQIYFVHLSKELLYLFDTQISIKGTGWMTAGVNGVDARVCLI